MPDTINLLDQAIELGRKELDVLSEGDVESAEDISRNRYRVTNDAMEADDTPDLETLLEKLEKLKSLQGRITSEAKRLHAVLKNDLVRSKQENRRFSGYKSAVGSPVANNRFINRRG